MSIFLGNWELGCVYFQQRQQLEKGGAIVCVRLEEHTDVQCLQKWPHFRMVGECPVVIGVVILVLMDYRVHFDVIGEERMQ